MSFQTVRAWKENTEYMATVSHIRILVKYRHHIVYLA